MCPLAGQMGTQADSLGEFLDFPHLKAISVSLTTPQGEKECSLFLSGTSHYLGEYLVRFQFKSHEISSNSHGISVQISTSHATLERSQSKFLDISSQISQYLTRSPEISIPATRSRAKSGVLLQIWWALGRIFNYGRTWFVMLMWVKTTHLRKGQIFSNFSFHGYSQT